MNGKDSRLLRSFMAWAGITSPAEMRTRKRAWDAMNHRQRGEARQKILQVMAANPTPVTRTTTTGLDRFGR